LPYLLPPCNRSQEPAIPDRDVGEAREQEAVALHAICALNLKILNHNPLRPDLIKGFQAKIPGLSDDDGATG
jgi:hypothetical protein